MSTFEKQRLSSSFRDPSGYIIYNKEAETVQRVILSSYHAQYAHLMQCGLYEKLVKNNLLVKHQLISQSTKEIIIEPQQIPFISYPYEWSFQLLKEAALLTLDVAKEALNYNMYLKDATSYNVQLFYGKPIFIDTLSFEFYQEGAPWCAYGQFCRHFLAPLLFMKYKTLTVSKILAQYIDGLPLEFVSDLLPFHTHFSPFIKMNIHMHSKKLKQFNSNQTIAPAPKLNKKKLQHMFEYMSLFIRSLNYTKSKTEWGDYYNNTNYLSNAFNEKANIISHWIERMGAKKLWDAGGNNGHFSRHIVHKAKQIIVTDIDPVAIDYNYKINKEKQIESIVPLVVDLTNPSPAIGFDNQERLSFTARLLEQQIDCTLVLALIHHLCLSNNCTFEMVLSYFKRVSLFSIIEFVPPEDSWAQTLLAQKRESQNLFNFYNQDNFESVCGEHFDIVDKITIPDSLRTLYLLKRK
ncbi:class I SAM-dependent methyltransferase [Legionella jamestowniensis]|uniref:Methyltransferase domain protein n=1 Tax=Legionella jamestowniensis TaxID=455 RepID=A0A0W0UGM9_9GAMM|nr:class I SAM-dependent methyltransferase [Legionella jamestowniensis]KTD06823.1 hypothetical protein Ljam_1018 [Legionella jamestowniensis]SFL82669.1 hypothetical protein SAMN02746073_2093 [Legionella jamestowniensis DSM 19215]